MAKFKSDDLLEGLKKDVQQLMAAVQFIKGADKVKLAYSFKDGRWTVVQIIEHLNMYGRYYLPAIERAIAVKTGDRDSWFNSGMLGNYFTNMMKPKTVYEIKNKMKTPKGYIPGSGLNVDKVINEFNEQHQQLLKLLDTSRDRNLNNVRIPISITRLVKLKLGDTFRFYVAHEQRHMIQARNTLHELGIATDKFPVILQAEKQ